MKTPIYIPFFMTVLMTNFAYSDTAFGGNKISPEKQGNTHVAKMLRDAIISTALFSKINEELAFDLTYGGIDGSATAPLMVFDSLKGPDANCNIAELASFYLGEASDENYECIVQRKGESIVEALKSELGKSPTTCDIVVKSIKSARKLDKKTDLILNNLCLSNSETHAKIMHLIKLAESSSSCNLEM